MRIMRLLMVSGLLLVTGILTGCTTTGSAFNGTTGDAPARTVMRQQASIKTLEPVKACAAPYIKGKRIALAPTLNNTGKTNAVADAGTGDFLTGTQTANFAIPLLRSMGVTIQSINNENVELIYRRYLPDHVAAQRARVFASAKPNYILDVTPLSLDFDRTSNFSTIIKGLGGFSDMQRATVAGGAKLLKGDGSFDLAGYGVMKLSVFSTQSGILVGRVFGNTLATGEAGIGIQQPLQLWNGEFVVQISTLMAVTDLPGVPGRCRQMLDTIVKPDVVNI